MRPCPLCLPEGYCEAFRIDLQKDKKLALGINIAAGIVFVAMALPALHFVPIASLFSFDRGIAAYALRFAVMLLGYFLYIVIHELTHGLFIRIFSGQKPTFGFTGLYAYAGSSAYFSKVPYLIIALSPVVIWGVALFIINLLVPVEWFYVVYFIQMGNISGAAGDLYVTFRFLKLPKDILVQDSGVSMTVYKMI